MNRVVFGTFLLDLLSGQIESLSGLVKPIFLKVWVMLPDKLLLLRCLSGLTILPILASFMDRQWQKLRILKYSTF